MAVLLVAAAAFFAACGGGQTADAPDEEGAATEEASPEETSEGGGGQEYPDILEAELERSGDAWDVDVTVSSPYDSPERYADGWRVLSPDGDVLGEHELMHDHASEQPFTRTQTGIGIPDGVEEVTIEGRDLENGYGGETVTVPVEGA